MGTLVVVTTFDDPWGLNACQPDGRGGNLCHHSAGPAVLGSSGLVSCAGWLLALPLVTFVLGAFRTEAPARGRVAVARLAHAAWAGLVVAVLAGVWQFSGTLKKSGDGMVVTWTPGTWAIIIGCGVTVASAIAVAGVSARGGSVGGGRMDAPPTG